MPVLEYFRSRIVSTMAVVENIKAPAWTWLAAFLAIVFLRNILELFSAAGPVYSPRQFFLHYPLAYAGPFLALGLILSAGSGESIGKVGRLLVVAWSLTLLPPLLRMPGEAGPGNIIFYGVPVDRLGYSMPMEGPDYLLRLLFFFSPLHRFPGTTWGIRLETLLACLLAILFVRLKGAGWGRTAATAVGVYLTSLFFFHLPMLFFSLGSFLFPGVSFADFFWGEGILARGAAAERHVPLNLFYLVIICSLLAAGWAYRWCRDAWWNVARRRLGPLLLIIPFAGIAGLLFGLTQVGAAGSGRTPVPFDGFALLSVLLALAAAAAAVTPPQPPAVRSGGGPAEAAMEGGFCLTLSAAAVLLALVGGVAPATLLLTLLGCLFLFSRAPFLPPGLRGGAAVGWTLAGVLASLTGYSLFVGPEAIPLFPREFLAAAALSWFPAFLAVDFTRLGTGFRVTGFLLTAASPGTLAAVFGLPYSWIGAGLAAGLLLGAALWLPSPLNRLIPASAPVVLTVLILLLAGGGLQAEMRIRTLATARFHSRQAQNQEAAGHLEEALRSRRLAVRLAPKDPLTHYDLGVILARLGRNQEAAAAFADSVRLDPDFAEGFENLGYVYMALQDPRAEAAFRNAIGAWERRLDSADLPVVARRLARQRIFELGDLLAGMATGTVHSR